MALREQLVTLRLQFDDETEPMPSAIDWEAALDDPSVEVVAYGPPTPVEEELLLASSNAFGRPFEERDEREAPPLHDLRLPGLAVTA